MRSDACLVVFSIVCGGFPLKSIKHWLLLGLGLGGFLATAVTLDLVRHVPTSNATAPVTLVDGEQLGRAYAPTVVASLSDAWDAAADALGQGKSLTEAQEILQQTWQELRAKAFVATVANDFAKVLPEGTEPSDDVQRAEVVTLWRAFARGLKGGR
jgi:hypothetical protein